MRTDQSDVSSLPRRPQARNAPLPVCKSASADLICLRWYLIHNRLGILLDWWTLAGRMYDAGPGFCACIDSQSCQQCRIQHTVQDASTAVIRSKLRWSNVRDSSAPHHDISAQPGAFGVTTSHASENVVHDVVRQIPACRPQQHCLASRYPTFMWI